MSNRVIDIVGLDGHAMRLRSSVHDGRRTQVRCIRVNLDNLICRVSFFSARCLLGIVPDSISVEIAGMRVRSASPQFVPSVYSCLFFFVGKYTAYKSSNCSLLF